MHKGKMLMAVAIFAVVMLVGVAGCTQADIQALQGTLKNVDSVSGNVTVTLKDGTTQTFNFADVKVDTIKQALGNATLDVGDQVTVKVHQNGDVDEVDVKNAEVEGTVKGVGTNSITVTTKKQGDVTLNVTADTQIRNQGKSPAALSDLQQGQEVEAKYDVSNKNALRINAGASEEKNEGEIQGVVKGVDKDNKTITVTTEKNGDVTLKVNSDTKIKIEDEHTAALSDVKTGQHIEGKYDKSNNNALKLTLENSNKGNSENRGQPGNQKNQESRNNDRED